MIKNVRNRQDRRRVMCYEQTIMMKVNENV